MRAISTVVVVIVVSVGTLCAGEVSISAAPAGLRVVAHAPDRQESLRAFHSQVGTTLSVLLTSPQGGIVGIATEESKVSSCTDNKGKDLTRSEATDPKDVFAQTPGFEMMPTVSQDGTMVLAEIYVPGVPSKGAEHVQVSAQALLEIGTTQKDFSADNVALKEGTEIKAGSIPFKIIRAGKPEWGDEPFAVTLEAKQDTLPIVSIEFFDAKGNKLVTRRGGSSRMHAGANVTVNQEWIFKEKVDSAKVVVNYWLDLKRMLVPIQLKVGPGL